MKNTLIIITLLLYSLSVMAQDASKGKYIEVLVQDTLTVEPDFVEYVVHTKLPIYVGDEYADDNYSTNSSLSQDRQRFEEERKIKDAYANKQLQQLFKKHNIPFREFEVTEFATLSNVPVPSIAYLLTFTNLQKLSVFYKEAKAIENIESYVYNRRSSRIAFYEKQLMERLIGKAKEKAGVIAQASQRKLSGVIQVNEISEYAELNTNSGGWTTYPPLNAGISGYFAANISVRITLQRMLRVRFDIEN